MVVEEVYIKVKMLETVHFTQILEKNAKIAQLMLGKSESAKKEHLSRDPKLYTFSSLLPIERDGMYKKGEEYFFKIRTLKENYKKLFLYSNEGLSNGAMVITGTELRKVEIPFIEKLITKSPVLYSEGKRDHFTRSSGIIRYIRGLTCNIEYKAEVFERLNQKGQQALKIKRGEVNFIQDIIFRETKPAICYKGTKFVAEKFALLINEGEKSQYFAYIAVMTGLGQKNSSMGAGFVDFF